MLQEKKAQEQEVFERILQQNRDYNARRVALQQQYADDMSALERGRTTANAEQVDAAKLQAARTLADALRTIDEEELAAAQKTAPLLVDLYADAAEKSRAQLRQTMEQTRQLLDYLRTTKAEDITPKFGFTAAQLRMLQSSPDQLKAISDAFERLRSQAEASTHPLERFVNSLRTLFKQGATSDDKKQALKGLEQSSFQLTGMLSQGLHQLSEAYKELDEGASESLESIANFIDGASNIAQGFLQGGIVGGAMAAVGTLFVFDR